MHLPINAYTPVHRSFYMSYFMLQSCTSLHVTVYPDGRVCISILHAPGDDPMGYETSAERWSPVQSVEKILLSVVSMLAGKKENKIALFQSLGLKKFFWKAKDSISIYSLYDLAFYYLLYSYKCAVKALRILNNCHFTCSCK